MQKNYDLGRSGKQKSQRLRQIKKFSCHFHHNFASDNYDDGFFGNCFSRRYFSLLVVFIFVGSEKQYGADSFISVNILLVANSECVVEKFFVTFLLNFCPKAEQKSIFSVKTFMMTNQMALKDSLFCHPFFI
jgi:hypothetical protein